MARSLNICLISREFPPDTAFGGIATYSADTALMLKAHGHRVTVFSQSLGPSQVLDYHGIEVHKIRVPSPFDSYQRLPLFILGFNAVVYREVRRYHRKQPFDLIDVPDHLAEGLFATLFSRLPVVTRLHTPFALLVAMGLNNYRRDLAYQFIKAMERVALRGSAALYAPCMDLVRRCEPLFGIGEIPLRIFGYPLDLELFSPGPSLEGQPSRILFLGRLEQRKGIETIVAAFPEVSRRHPGTMLTLVGRDTPNIGGYPSARQYMKEAFERAGCADSVRFQDNVPLEQLPSLFRSHQIVWVPSLYDNYPLTCLEALACKKAVIVADSGGLPEMVSQGRTGLIFPAGDAAALSELTSQLLNSPERIVSLGEAGRQFVLENCSAEVIYAKTMDLYEAALGAWGRKDYGAKNRRL